MFVHYFVQSVQVPLGAEQIQPQVQCFREINGNWPHRVQVQVFVLQCRLPSVLVSVCTVLRTYQGKCSGRACRYTYSASSGLPALETTKYRLPRYL